jgi:DNA-binding FadR family transcriptional regulator
MHPSGWHMPVVGAVLAGDGEAAFAAMRRHAVEFGERLIKMEKAFRQKNSPPAPKKVRQK